jgi:hypothetical protein
MVSPNRSLAALRRWVNDPQTQMLFEWPKISVAGQQFNLVFDTISSDKAIHCFADSHPGFPEQAEVPGAADRQVGI